MVTEDVKSVREDDPSKVTKVRKILFNFQDAMANDDRSSPPNLTNDDLSKVTKV